MLKTMAKAITGLVIAAVIAVGAYAWTMTHLEIITDGDGDSAFITCAGQEWFCGINNHPIDKDGTNCEYIAPMKYEQKTR